MAAPSLYRRVLGSRFDELPAVLHRFHDSPVGGRARGTFFVVRGRGWLRNVAASLLKMPTAGQDLPVELEVVVEGDKERWARHFPGRQLITVQWAEGDTLLERFGWGTFACKLVVDGSCLRYEFQRAWFAGVPLPGRLAPVVNGLVIARDSGWQVVVHASLPLLGEIVHYEGWVEPE
jgi:hypothetical protein